eukprot:CAMPEP_0119570636 /NCGR_PEP_ID=MMETSP1352-20130426/43710_1 /TAXON_ID=265584 /ORGANISM="Stauroneis constricta, Strain CCMP1120" /LENGTH=630 /DNA_ID=CAMNT_0007620305 /DNA_START=110 /DNA_END=1998 /DNA_ORIENTATION=+
MPRSIQNKSSLLFIAVDHLNSVNSKDHRFLLELNTKVAERTMDLGALSSASKYGEIAFSHLDKIREPWEQHYDITLRLHRVKTNAELALGNYETGYKLGDELCEHSKTPIDAMPTIISKAAALSKEDKRTQSIECAVQAAQTMLGVYPKRSIVWTIIKELIWIKSYFRRHKDADILEIPPITDAKHLLSMQLLSQIISSAMQNGRVMEWLVAMVKSIRVTIKHGVCEHAALAFTFLGLLTFIQGDSKGAIRFANLATSILQRTNGESTKGFVYVVCPAAIFRWSKSSVFCMDLLHQGYHAAMGCGDIEAGSLSFSASNCHAYFDGYPVHEVYKAYGMLEDEMKLYNVHSNKQVLLQFRNGLSMLLGRKPIDWDEIEHYGDTDRSITESDEVLDEKDIRYPFIYGCSLRILICMLFSKFELAELLCKKMQQRVNLNQDPAYELQTNIYMYIGLASAGMYRQTKRNKHLQSLRKLKKMFVRFCNVKGKSCTNRALILRAELKSLTTPSRDWRTVKRAKSCTNRALILRAELKSLTTPSRDWRTVKRAYDLAITATTDLGEPFKSIGHPHEAGITSELAANYLLSVGQPKLAGQYFTSAMYFYQRWGVTAKVDHFQVHRKKYIDQNQLRELHR